MNKKTITVNNLTAGDFPPAVRPFWENVPNSPKLRLALTLASIVCYCGLSPRLRVKYTFDSNFLSGSMLLLNLLVIGPSGSGKSAIRWAVNMLMNAQIIRDTEERRRLREYKEKPKKEREKTQEPMIVCRFLQKATLPIIVKYADIIHRRYKDWLSFFLYGDELAAFKAGEALAAVEVKREIEKLEDENSALRGRISTLNEMVDTLARETAEKFKK